MLERRQSAAKRAIQEWAIQEWVIQGRAERVMLPCTTHADICVLGGLCRDFGTDRGWHAGTYDSVKQVHHEEEQWLGASGIGDGDLALGLQQNLAFHTNAWPHAFLEG